MGRRHTRSDEMRAAQAEKFAARLADLLSEFGLTHKDVAQALGVPVGTVDSWTRGSDPKIPGEANFGALCALLDARRAGAGESLAQVAGRSWSPLTEAAPTAPLPGPTTPLEAGPSTTTNLLPTATQAVREKSAARAFVVPIAIVLALLVVGGGALLLQGRGVSSGSGATPTPGTSYTPPPGGTISAIIADGDRLLAEREAEQALSAYEMALATEPRQPRALLGKGRALADLERYEEAVETLTSALSASPGDPAVLLVRARVFLRMQYWDFAAEDAARLLEADSASLDAILARAHARAGAGDWTSANADYTRALETRPNDPAVYLDRGRAYLERENVAQAIEDFEHALSLAPSSAEAMTALGKAYLVGTALQPNKALEYFSKAINADAANSDAYYWRGYVYQEHRVVASSARDDFTQAIEIGPANSRLHLARAQSYETLGDPQAQLADLDRAVALDPRNSTSYHRRYQYFYRNLDYRRALDNIDTELESQPDDPQLHIYRSELNLLLNELAQAEADALKAVELGSQYAPPYIALAQALAAQQKYPDALAEAERAVSADDPDNHVAALAARGWVHLKMGQLTQAAADFEEALRGEPFDRLVRLGRASLAIQNGQYEAALPDIETGISQYDRYGLGYLLRAKVALAQNEPDKARADLESANQRILYPDELAQVDALLAQIK